MALEIQAYIICVLAIIVFILNIYTDLQNDKLRAKQKIRRSKYRKIGSNKKW